MNKNCKFCNIINKKSIKKYDKILYETNNFVIVVSLGAFIEGYLLILPKKHILSFSELNINELNELEKLKNLIKKINKKYYNKRTIIFENGSSGSKDNNGLFKDSIVHAHLHLVPFETKNKKELFNNIYNNINYNILKNYYEIRKYMNNYYIYCEYDEIMYLSTERELLERQWIRKILANNLNIKKYNWRKDNCLNICKSTIKKYSKYFQEINLI